MSGARAGHTPCSPLPQVSPDLPLSSAPRGSLRLVSWPERPRLKIDLHFLTFKDPFLLGGGGDGEIAGVGAVVSAGSGAQGEALLVLGNLNDGVVGPHLRGSIPRLQDARQLVGQGPGHEVLGATRRPDSWE